MGYYQDKMFTKEALINRVVQGHVLDVLRQMPSGMVDMCVTSPPYWSLRDYKTPPQVWDAKNGCEHEWVSQIKKGISGGTKSEKVQIKGKDNFQITSDSESAFCLHCNAWRGSLGLEPTIELYLSHLYAIFDEVKRVLRDEGTLWVNIGDSYAGSKIGNTETKKNPRVVSDSFRKSRSGVPAKSLCLIPQRFAVGMVERGWICRNEIIWKKNSCMPESVKDRFTRDFEHVFFFTKSQRYFFEQQFEAHKQESIERMNYGWNGNRERDSTQNPQTLNIKQMCGSQGRNMRCVWEINPKPFVGAHFATFAPKLVERCLRAGCPEFVCSKCGKGREKIIEHIYSGGRYDRGNHSDNFGFKQDVERETIDKGYSDCGCGAGFIPGLVLDPFLGSGTTALVAKMLNKDFVGVELSEEYVKMAERRLAQPCQTIL